MTGPRTSIWSARSNPPCPRRRSRSSRPGRSSKRSSQAKATAGELRDEVVVAVAGAPKAVATAGTAIRVDVAEKEEEAAATVVPGVVATVAVADLLAAVGDAT